MHALFTARLVNDPFGDPGLYLDFQDARRALLFDLGDIQRLMPRHLMRLTQVFVTHTHMDHFSGFDRLLRVVLGRKPVVALYGGVGFIAQVEHKLRAYSWNVAHRYEMPLSLEVVEICRDGGLRRARFSSLRRFAREDLPGRRMEGDIVHDESCLRVRACRLDHGMQCLAYLVEEKARLRVAKDRILALGLGTGAWLRELKHAVLSGAPDDAPLELRWRDRGGEHRATRRVGELRHLVLDRKAGQRVGYVTDLRYTAANVETLAALMGGADQLFIESVFLHRDREHARRKNHLTARQAGLLARRIGAAAVTPFHFSPRYQGCAEALVEELESAWLGAPSVGEAASGEGRR